MIGRRSALHGSAVALSGGWLRQARADEFGTLTVALSDNPVTCDPINMSSHDSEILSQTIFENLVEFDIEDNLKPQLAKALPAISADGLVYTFDLRDDVLFQDGSPLTSEDVKYSIEYTIDPTHKATRGPIFKLLSHVATDGPHRLHVHLKEPFAPWTSYLTKFMGVWPAGSREKHMAMPISARRRSTLAPGRVFSRSGSRTTLSAFGGIRTTGRKDCRTGTGWWLRSCRRTRPASPFCWPVRRTLLARRRLGSSAG